jgi:signal transduction histidine kinase
MVHDMRSPLMGISGNLEYVLPHCAALPSDDQEGLKDALSSANRLIDMVSSMLDVSRLEAGQMPVNHVTCDLRRAAQETVQRLSGLLRQHPVTIAAMPEEVQVPCDSTLIQRVLVNLLGNAAKFSPLDSPIRIEFQNQPGSLKVTVCDRGPGIPLEYHAKIFEKFGQVEAHHQHQNDSTGLGLTFCRLAVEAHGGQIGVDSTVGHGSAFWFTLPRQSAQSCRETP